MAESQESQLTNLAEIVSEMMKRIDDQELRNKTIQTQNGLEVQAMKRRLEDLQNHAIKDAKTIREEYDTAVDSLGNLMEDVARRVTKAVQSYEERLVSDMEKLRQHVDKTLNHQSLVVSQKLDAALAAAESRQDDREGGSEDANSGTASTAKLPSRNTDIIMRRIESMAHMLRAEALAQAQAFEAKLTSMEASSNAESKRVQGMVQSNYAQIQSLQRSMSAWECGVGPTKPQSPRNSAGDRVQDIIGSMKMPPRRPEAKETGEPTLREELTNKLRNIQSSVTGVLTVLDSSSGTAGTAGTAGTTRGQSPLSNKRFAKSPVNLPLNPAGTLEKQMLRQKEFESQGRGSSPLLTTLKEGRASPPARATLKEEASQGQDAHLLLPNTAAIGAAESHGTHPAISGLSSTGAPAPRMHPETALSPAKIMAQPPKRPSHGGMVASPSQGHIPQMSGMAGMVQARMVAGAYPMHPRSGMHSPGMIPAMTPQAIPMHYGNGMGNHVMRKSNERL